MKRILCLLTALIMITGCSPQTENKAEGTITSGQNREEKEYLLSPEDLPEIDGSLANVPLIAGLITELTGIPRETAETMVDVSGGTGEVWRSFLYNYEHMALAYEAPESVKEELAFYEVELEIDPIGRDALIFIVNADNPIENITREQLVDIYTGKITNWSQVGGSDMEIMPFQRNQESGSQTLFLKLLMDGIEPMTPDAEYYIATMLGIIERVADYDNSPGALGFSVYYYAQIMMNNPDVKILTVDGIEPSNESIKNGSYPLTNEFYAVIFADTPEDDSIRIVRDWLLTDEGKKFIEAEGYVALQ